MTQPPHPNETQPLLARPGHVVSSGTSGPSSHNSKLLKLLPVLILASICRGISMFSRFAYYGNSPTRPWERRSWFTLWVKMPGVTVQMELWSMYASFVVSFITVGWWSAFGDRRGRKPVLLVSILGAVLVDFIYMIVANSQQDGVSLGLIVEGLLGGFATFKGVVHAYGSDLSRSPLSRMVIFAAIQAISFTFFRFGALLGQLADPIPDLRHSDLGYVISVLLGCCNLAYIYRVLPESLAPASTERQDTPTSDSKTALQYIIMPFSLFLLRAPSRNRIVLLAFSIYMYSWTAAFGVRMVVFTSNKGFFPALPRPLLLLIPNLLNLLTWLFLLPGLAFILKRRSGDTENSGRRLEKSIAQNSILTAAMCLIGTLIFGGARSSPLYAIFFFAYSFTVGALPALYSLAASYFVTLGRSSELGALFGTLSIWVSLGEYISYSSLGDSEWSLDYRLEWTAAFLVISLLLLVPDGPPTQTEEVSVDPAEERV
ncbi:hypothetical protein B0H17DRAFT_435320 [Mycena rosella]|uniref:MFS general substrate transporter n=1 Tax=Mycena rosella TaxID=1033263 RepID=A0AAD7CH58_MYCRO|nr:hypothetical protein B0H17DRAFT_435320 [Mycena rosella]